MTDTHFTKQDTQAVKGLAALLLIIHHTLGVNPGVPAPLFSAGSDFWTVIGGVSKACVAVFLILSGYGMTEKARSAPGFGYRDVFRQLGRLYRVYWTAFVLLALWQVLRGGFASLAALYGAPDGEAPVRPLLWLLKDLLGLYDVGYDIGLRTPTLNAGTWFLGALLLCYLLFPLLLKAVRKGGIPAEIALLAASFAPWVWYLAAGDLNMHTDREIFYVFPFCLGMVLSRHGLLSRLKDLALRCRCRALLASAAGLILSLFLRQAVCLPADSLLALAMTAVMVCLVCVCRENRAAVRFFRGIGSLEAWIYYLHPVGLTLLAEISFYTTGCRVLATCVLCILIASGCSAVYRSLTGKRLPLPQGSAHSPAASGRLPSPSESDS